MVEIIPKQIKKTPPWQSILFYFSLTILIASIAIYFILGNFLKESSVILTDLESEVKKGKTAEEQSLESRILGYQKKIEDFSRLIENYQQASKFFDFIQESTHPKVWFSAVEVNRNENQTTLGGSAENFQALGQQFLIFKNSPLIKNISLSNIIIGENGRVEFSLRLRFDPQIFTPKN